MSEEIDRAVQEILDRCVAAHGTVIPLAFYEAIRAALTNAMQSIAALEEIAKRSDEAARAMAESDAMHLAQSESRGRALLSVQRELRSIAERQRAACVEALREWGQADIETVDVVRNTALVADSAPADGSGNRAL